MSLKIHTSILDKLNYFHKMHKIPNIIFHGSSGCGKKTIIDKFINIIYNNDREKIKSFVMYVNCAHGKGIKFIREDLKFFAKTHIQSNGGDIFKSIVLFNADKLTIDAQSALRRCIELFSHTTRFFIVVEDKFKLLKPILSRFCEIYVPEPMLQNEVINLYNYNLNINYVVRTIYKLFNKRYLIKGYNNDFYLERSNKNEKKIIKKIFKNKITTRYTELLFHPDLKIKTGAIKNLF